MPGINTSVYIYNTDIKVSTKIWANRRIINHDAGVGEEEEGDPGGLGDVGKPIIREWRFPRSERVTVMFNPRDAAKPEALDWFAVGVSGGDTRTWPWLDEASVAMSASVPLSSCMDEKSSVSDWPSSAGARGS